VNLRHQLHDGLNLAEGTVRQFRQGKTGRKTFENGAYFVELLDLRIVQLGHNRSSAWNKRYETISIQPLQRLANWHSANPELGRNRLLVNLCSGGKFTFDNALAKLVKNEATQGRAA
jgi:hypothetical protein